MIRVLEATLQTMIQTADNMFSACLRAARDSSLIVLQVNNIELLHLYSSV